MASKKQIMFSPEELTTMHRVDTLMRRDILQNAGQSSTLRCRCIGGHLHTQGKHRKENQI